MTAPRVLITGFTAQQVGRQPGLKYDSVSSLLAEGFRQCGFGVEHRMVAPDEDPSEYDLVAVGISPLLSLNTLHIYAALSLIGCCEAMGVNLVLYVDDWQFKSLKGQYGTVLRKPERLTKQFFEYKSDHAWAQANQSYLIEVVDRLNSKPWPTTLIPAYTWGDRTFFKEQLHWAPEQVYYDPSIFARQYEVTAPAERERAWVLGALVENDKWLDGLEMDWPVKRFGKLPKEKGKGQRVKESELIQAYADNRGIISIPYPHAGSGWWRNRFVYAERTGSLVLASPDEVGCLGDGFTWQPRQMEGMADNFLDQLAEHQGYVLRSKYETVPELTEKLRGLL